MDFAFHLINLKSSKSISTNVKYSKNQSYFNKATQGVEFNELSLAIGACTDSTLVDSFKNFVSEYNYN